MIKVVDLHKRFDDTPVLTGITEEINKRFRTVVEEGNAGGTV